MSTELLTAERLREVLHYDPETGEFRWRVSRRNGVKAGDVAGTVTNYGYRQIRVDGRCYRASRLAFLYMTGEWPSHEIDHRDNDPSNDRWSNLREATGSQNQANKRRQINNTSGYKGVTYHRDCARWQAQIMVHGRMRYLGLYDTREEAFAVRCSASRRYHGDFANLGISSPSIVPDLEPATERPVTESKDHQIGEMLLRPEGVTRTEVLQATGWPSVSIPQQAGICGIEIVSQRSGREVRYWARNAALEEIA